MPEVNEFKLIDKTNVPGFLGLPVTRWIYAADNEGRYEPNLSIQIALSPGEFKRRGRPGTLFVTLTAKQEVTD